MDIKLGVPYMISEKMFIDKFAEIVQKYRLKRGYSIEKLASESELSYPTVNLLINRHKKRITAYLMMKLTKALNIPMTEIQKII
jgi:transcriptional regulator with XRE-family HTH domain